MGYRKPKKGFDWNPLMKLERNSPCICDSGKKYKKCCLPHMPAILPIETINKLFVEKTACPSQATGATKNTPPANTAEVTEGKRKLEVVRSYLSSTIVKKLSALTTPSKNPTP